MYLKKRILIEISIVLILLPIVNAAPLLINATTDSNTYNLGDNVTFTAYYSDPGIVKLVIDISPAFTNCDFNIQTGCLAYSSNTTSSPAAAVYTTTSSGAVTWYAQICDSTNTCDTGTASYNFSGITSPSSTHKAQDGNYNCTIPLPKSPSYLISGSEANNTEYSQISDLDANNWLTYFSGLSNKCSFQRFTFDMSSFSSMPNLNLFYRGAGYGSFGGANGSCIYFWNYTSSSWVNLTACSTSFWTNFSINTSQNDFFNNSIEILAATRTSSGGAGETELRTDFIQLTADINISGAYTVNATPVPPLPSFNNTLTIRYTNPSSFLDYSSEDRLAFGKVSSISMIGLASEGELESIAVTSNTLQLKSRTTQYIFYTNPVKSAIEEVNEGLLVGQAFDSIAVPGQESGINTVSLKLFPSDVVFTGAPFELQTGTHTFVATNVGVDSLGNPIINIKVK